MFTVLQYPYLDAFGLTEAFTSRNSDNAITQYLTFGKVAERPIVSPSIFPQVITPSAKNKFLYDVTVLPQ